MKRKTKKGGIPPRWIVTYSDMVTLLLAFFVMMLAMSSFEDMKRVDAVMGSIQSALGQGAMIPMAMGQTHADSDGQTESEDGPRQLQSMRAVLQESMADHISDDMVRLTQVDSEIRIQLSDRVLFASGSTTLHPIAYQLINDLADVLRDKQVQVMIEGHADGTGDWKANWHVSSQRALAVLIALQERGGVEGKNLQSNARGQFMPSAPESGASDWNRRVEIVIKTRDASAYEAIEILQGGW